MIKLTKHQKLKRMLGLCECKGCHKIAKFEISCEVNKEIRKTLNLCLHHVVKATCIIASGCEEE